MNMQWYYFYLRLCNCQATFRHNTRTAKLFRIFLRMGFSKSGCTNKFGIKTMSIWKKKKAVPDFHNSLYIVFISDYSLTTLNILLSPNRVSFIR